MALRGPEFDITTYIGSLILDIHDSLKANYALHHQSKLTHTKLSMRHIRARSRSIGSRLKDLPTLYSGLASEQALINKYNHNTRWCVEHRYPRQVAGYDLYYWAVHHPLYSDDCIEELVLKLRDCRTVNFTTKEENRSLYKHQLYGRFQSHTQAYADAGIKLLAWPKGTKICNLPELHPHIIPKLHTHKMAKL